MDRIINVRMYSIQNREDRGMAFSAALRHISALPLLGRESEVEPEVTLRLERLEPRERLLFGDIVRVQSTNLPPRALPGEPLARLGVRRIGHPSAFAFDPELSVLALQTSRNGITPTRVALYAEQLSGANGYDILPVPDRDTLEALRNGGVRGISFRISTPNELTAIDEQTRSAKVGMVRMKNSLQPAQIEIAMTMKRGDPDFDRRTAIPFVGWLLREREERRGDISKVRARITPEEGEAAQSLNLITGHMGDKGTIDLPDDEPDRNYDLRIEYVRSVLRAHHAVLAEMFGDD